MGSQVQKGETGTWQRKASSLAADVEMLQEQWNKVSDHLRGDLRTRKSELRLQAEQVLSRARISKDSSDSFLALLGQSGQADIGQILKQSHSNGLLDTEHSKHRSSTAPMAPTGTAVAANTAFSSLGVKKSPRAPGADFLGSLRRPEQT